MSNPFKEIFDLEKKTLEQHSRMIKPLEMVGVGIAITTRLNNKVLMDIMKRNDLSFKTNEDVRSFGRKTEEFTIVDNTGKELTLYPTSIGYMVKEHKADLLATAFIYGKRPDGREPVTASVTIDEKDTAPMKTAETLIKTIGQKYMTMVDEKNKELADNEDW